MRVRAATVALVALLLGAPSASALVWPPGWVSPPSVEPYCLIEQGAEGACVKGACLLPFADPTDACYYGVATALTSVSRTLDYDSTSCLPAVGSFHILVHHLPAVERVHVLIASTHPHALTPVMATYSVDGAAELTFVSFTSCTKFTVTVSSEAGSAPTLIQLDFD